MKKKLLLIVLFFISQVSYSQSKTTSSQNPVLSGSYDDPEGVLFKKKYRIYTTFSASYNQQVFFDAFSSPDLVHCSKHGSSYSVPYGTSDSPFVTFERIGKILQQDAKVATDAVHHSVNQVPGKDLWYIVYHGRPISKIIENQMVISIDAMTFDKHGEINPIKITQ